MRGAAAMPAIVFLDAADVEGSIPNEPKWGEHRVMDRPKEMGRPSSHRPTSSAGRALADASPEAGNASHQLLSSAAVMRWCSAPVRHQLQIPTAQQPQHRHLFALGRHAPAMLRRWPVSASAVGTLFAGPAPRAVVSCAHRLHLLSSRSSSTGRCPTELWVKEIAT